MKLSFAVAALLSTFALADTWNASWGEAADSEVPDADLKSNAISWTGPKV